MDENSKVVDGGAVKPTTENSATTSPNPNSDVITTNSIINSSENNNGGGGGGVISSAGDGGSDGGGPARQSSRTPFTNLSQVDADLALARTLQEQERAYMMLSMNAGGMGYGMWETGIYVPDDEDDDFDDSHEHGYDEGEDEDDDNEGDEEIEDDMENYDDEDEDEDAFDVHAHDDDEYGDSDAENVELDPSAYPDDESYARALQDAEEREMAARLLAMAGLTEREVVDVEDHGGHSQPSQDTWTPDPDELSYEELLALGDVVGTESRGLSADTIALLPSTNYSSQGNKETETDPCVICRLDFEDGDPLTTLPCKHAYHSDCINNWLKIKKACPVCSTEVSTSTPGNI